MTNQDLIRFLSILCEQQHLVQRAIDGCFHWMQNEPENVPVGIGDVQAVFHSHKLCFEHSLLPESFIDTRLDLVAGGRTIGHYRLITLLDGTFDNDYLVFEA